MKRHHLSGSLATILLIVGLGSAPTSYSYEAVMHYGWTYYLALQVGFSERQAFQIASATDSIDWDDQTNPVASPLSTPIDTLLGGERWRYFDDDLHAKWLKLDKALKADSELRLREYSPYTTLLRILNAADDHALGTMLGGTWRNFYLADVARNPGVRTWLQIHAFQSIPLQSDGLRPPQASFIADNPDQLDLRTHGHVAFSKGSVPGFTYRGNFNALGDQVAPDASKNGRFSALDKLTGEFLTATVAQCESTLARCIKTFIDRVLADFDNIAPVPEFGYAVGQLKLDAFGVWLRNLREQPNINLSRSIDLLNAFTNLNDGALQRHLNPTLSQPASPTLGVQHDDIYTGYVEQLARSIAQLAGFLGNIRDYQRATSMQWPPIFDAMVNDIDRRLLFLYWNPRSPTDNAARRLATKAISASRGHVARSLTEIWKSDRNPGALLHFIQDMQPHGSYATYHGHAMANHVPDFVRHSMDNALRASIDTVLILCEFREWIANNPVVDPNAPPPMIGPQLPAQIYQAQIQRPTTLCRAAREDRLRAAEPNWDGENQNLSAALSIPIADSSQDTLASVLTTTGDVSRLPSSYFSRVSPQAAAIVIRGRIDEPPHTKHWENVNKRQIGTDVLVGPTFVRQSNCKYWQQGRRQIYPSLA